MKGTLVRVATATVAIISAAIISYQTVSADRKLPFNDISTSYARNEIIDLYNRGIITGTSLTTYSPVDSITRAEFITLLDRLLSLEPVISPVTPYTDLAQSAWYYGWIQAAVQLQLASGTSATTFAPLKAVTRQEAAVFIVRALKQAASVASTHSTFKDGSQIANWANAAVTVVNKLGLMKGDGTGNFRPSDPITRQEAAMLIYRVVHTDSWPTEMVEESQERIVLGWQYGQTVAEFESNIQQSNVNTLSPRWYFVGGTGSVSDSTDLSLVTWAKKNDKRIWAMVGNRSDQEATHQLLSNTTASHVAINQLLAIVNKYGLDGLNIDFENVEPKDRDNLTTFISILAEKLHAVDAILSIDVSPDLGTDWTDAFDYTALGRRVDYIVMMGYDEHYGGSVSAGPNASLPYVQRAIDKLQAHVSSDKVILAMPFYNRDWTLKVDGTASSSMYISLPEQNGRIKTYSLKPVWNASLGQYVASYTEQSMKHTIWFEDGRSLIAKYRLAVKERLGGVAYWYIGGESVDVWSSMRNAERFNDYSF